MRIISKPPKKREPKPPWRTAFLPVGTVAENDGHRWVLHYDYAMAGEKVWEMDDVEPAS